MIRLCFPDAFFSSWISQRPWCSFIADLNKILHQRVTGNLAQAVTSLIYIRGVSGSNRFLNSDYLEIFVGFFSHYRQVGGMISGFCCGAVDGRSCEMLRGVGC
jgi:hypothetical protein